MRRLNRDTLNMAAPVNVARASLTVLDRLQDFEPEIQIMGAAAVFLELAEHLGIPPQEAFAATKNLINGDDGKRVEFRAIAAYLQGELA
ncbi:MULTISPECIES: hypothetical protein [Sinorhizobium]|uniref:hypothetical protein n=1 Tax=Sinorhizobium TaxID=28105 RepID=UPI000FD99608|nr:hypothetical protein [Sinorhizobium medicae]RVP50032.1 hypothetical protein CN078_21580 [Sinorhizobium medicae]RVP74848.1 hypothetical protein CN079_20965 [Sinorhizobium medicae]UWU09428.1 hypothetical protein N2598_06715 [Sinorhizobium medicae]